MRTDPSASMLQVDTDPSARPAVCLRGAPLRTQGGRGGHFQEVNSSPSRPGIPWKCPRRPRKGPHRDGNAGARRCPPAHVVGGDEGGGAKRTLAVNGGGRREGPQPQWRVPHAAARRGGSPSPWRWELGSLQGVAGAGRPSSEGSSHHEAVAGDGRTCPDGAAQESKAESPVSSTP